MATVFSVAGDGSRKSSARAIDLACVSRSSPSTAGKHGGRNAPQAPLRQCERNVHALDERARVGPGLRAVAVSGGWLREVWRHAQRAELLPQGASRLHLGAGGTHRAHHEFERGLDLRQARIPIDELG